MMAAAAARRSETYGILEFDSVIRTIGPCCQESLREDFPIPGPPASVIHCPQPWSEAVMGVNEQSRIGYFGDMRREQAGAILLERVVATGSVGFGQGGGEPAGERVCPSA